MESILPLVHSFIHSSRKKASELWECWHTKTAIGDRILSAPQRRKEEKKGCGLLAELLRCWVRYPGSEEQAENDLGGERMEVPRLDPEW